MFALSNLNGLPGLAMPSGLDPEGLPAGVQLIVPAGRNQICSRSHGGLKARA